MPQITPVREIGGLPLPKIREQYRADLFDDFLPFMDRHIIDHELGGFMCHADRDGTLLSKNKYTWYQGRGTWVYSFLYNNFGKDKRYLDVARKTVEFMLKRKPSGDNLWAKEYTREGEPLAKDTQIYGDLFMAEGLAEYSKASGDPKYWDMAKDIVFKCVRIYDSPDYAPEIGRTYLGPSAPVFPGARIQGVWMVLIRSATQMLAMRQDAEVEKLAARAVDAVLNRHFNPEFRLTNELLNHDLSRPGSPYDQLVYTGHAIETLWMMLYEAARLKDRKLFDTFAERFERHVEVATDRVYGGVFRSLDNVDQNVWKVDKVLWEQGEVMVGTAFLMEHSASPWARETFGKMYRYLQDTYPMKRYGFPLWIEAGDRKVTFHPHAARVENYHHPRHLMLVLLSLDRIIARGGRPQEI